MGNCATDHLILSGNVFHGRIPFAYIGDVRLYPGANRTRLIDASIFDGRQWRSLDLSSFGVNRVFGDAGNVGWLMREATSAVSSRKGMKVYYEYPSSGRGRKYIFRGMSISNLLSANYYFSYLNQRNSRDTPPTKD